MPTTKTLYLAGATLVQAVASTQDQVAVNTQAPAEVSIRGPVAASTWAQGEAFTRDRAAAFTPAQAAGCTLALAVVCIPVLAGASTPDRVVAYTRAHPPGTDIRVRGAPALRVSWDCGGCDRTAQIFSKATAFSHEQRLDT